MIELTRSNDAVFLTWLEARLAEQDIAMVILDQHASILDGSISAVPRRVMVDERDAWRARLVLAEGEAIAAGD